MDLTLLQIEIEGHLGRIEKLFKKDARLSFAVRIPGNNEADVFLTRDDPKEVIALIKRRCNVRE